MTVEIKAEELMQDELMAEELDSITAGTRVWYYNEEDGVDTDGHRRAGYTLACEDSETGAKLATRWIQKDQLKAFMSAYKGDKFLKGILSGDSK